MDYQTILDLARRLATAGKSQEACTAYVQVLREREGQDPDVEMEAALHILQLGGDYKISFDTFVSLYHRRCEYSRDCLNLLLEAFYLPNAEDLQKQYEKNCKLLAKYPYLFQKEFLPFDELPILFFPYDDNGYRPFFMEKERFGEYVDFKRPAISRNFFADLEKPILAADVFSQYELEYLNDNVRKSEWVGRENHIYLHYTDWSAFCAHLQVLDFKPLLKEEKFVFLIGNEVAQYPMDFQVDYSQYPIRPIGIREVTRLIWHNQLSTHNGGDFFNEVLDNHPNLICRSSIMWDEVKAEAEGLKKALRKVKTGREARQVFAHWKDPGLAEELVSLRDRTMKDILVALYLAGDTSPGLDPSSRITPALLFQPHFHSYHYEVTGHEKGGAVRTCLEEEELTSSPMVQGFKYIKTFTPIRRFTTSVAATCKFMYTQYLRQKAAGVQKDEKFFVVGNLPAEAVFYRPFQIDPTARLYRDCVAVRFEDGKLNPKATFTALAAFLDIPYTESMTYCSLLGDRDYGGPGFDPAGVYRTHDQYLGESERRYIECLLKDAYDHYGYDFNYYDGAPMDETSLEKLISDFGVLDAYIYGTHLTAALGKKKREKRGQALTQEEEHHAEEVVAEYLRQLHAESGRYGKMLLGGLKLVNREGERLVMIPKLSLDPNL